MKKHAIKTDKNVRRSIGRKTWNLLSKLPLPIRGRLIRRMFEIDTSNEQELIFKKAETLDEIEQAFKVAYECYHERGLIQDASAQLRVTKYHALPTTAILIAKKGEEVIATVTVVVDSGLGLPLEKLWNLDELRQKTTRIAEISTLAIKRGHRAKRGKILLPLCKYMYEYSLYYLGVDTFVASYHPEVQDFYRCILMFSDLNDGEVKTYDFVQGAAAVAGYLDVGDLRKSYLKPYGDRPNKRNIMNYFMKHKATNFQFPDRPFYKSTDFTLSPALLQYFFMNQTNVLETLTPHEMSVIANTYFHPAYSSLLNEASPVDSIGIQKAPRVQPRFASFCNVDVTIAGSPHVYSGIAVEVSGKGLQLQLKEKLPADMNQKNVSVTIQISKEVRVPLSGSITWNQSDVSRVGVRLNQFAPQSWHRFIETLETELLQAVDGSQLISQERQKA